MNVVCIRFVWVKFSGKSNLNGIEDSHWRSRGKMAEQVDLPTSCLVWGLGWE